MPGGSRLRLFAENFEEYLAGSLLLVMVTIAFINVVTRYLVKYSLAFTEEIEVNFFVWVTILGIAIAFKKESHLSMVFIRDRLPSRTAKALKLFGLAASLAVFLVLIYLSSIHVYVEMTVFHTRSMALNIPEWIYLLGVPVFSVIVVIRIVQAILREVKRSA